VFHWLFPRAHLIGMRPASHVCEALALTQVKFASLESREWLLLPFRWTDEVFAFHVPQFFLGLKW
jgi:hypothetical protein